MNRVINKFICQNFKPKFNMIEYQFSKIYIESYEVPTLGCNNNYKKNSLYLLLMFYSYLSMVQYIFSSSLTASNYELSIRISLYLKY